MVESENQRTRARSRKRNCEVERGGKIDEKAGKQSEG